MVQGGTTNHGHKLTSMDLIFSPRLIKHLNITVFDESN